MVNEITVQYHSTSVGELIIGSYDGQLCLLDFRYRKLRKSIDDRLKKNLQAVFVEKTSDIIKETKKQLDAYLSGDRKSFDIPLLLVGSEFQKQVWKALQNIPYGTTITYQDIAYTINNEKAVRAVALANGANAIAIIIPCHRVIGSNGKLTGYGGGISVKKKLLILEKAHLPPGGLFNS